MKDVRMPVKASVISELGDILNQYLNELLQVLRSMLRTLLLRLGP